MLSEVIGCDIGKKWVKPLIFSVAQGVEAYSQPSRTSKIELFAKIVNGFQSLTIFAKSFILDV